MEPNCAVQILNSGKAWLHGFVSDDDSSCCAALKHSDQDKIDSRSQLTKTRVQKSFLLGCYSQLVFCLTHHIDDEFIEVIYTS